MQNYAVLSLIFGVVAVILTSPVSKASVISCPPSSLQEQANPALRQLCYAIEQAVDEVIPQQTQCEYFLYIIQINDRNHLYAIRLWYRKVEINIQK